MRLCRFLLVGALALAALPAAAGKPEVAHDPEADFSTYRTYTWEEGAPAGKPQVEIWIKRAIDDQLQAKGLREVTDGDADLRVASLVVTNVNSSIWSEHVSLATGTWGILRVDARSYTEGAWIVRLTDNARDQRVWLAIQKATLTGAWQKLEKKLPKFAEKMFQDYPP